MSDLTHHPLVVDIANVLGEVDRADDSTEIAEAILARLAAYYGPLRVDEAYFATRTDYGPDGLRQNCYLRRESLEDAQADVRRLNERYAGSTYGVFAERRIVSDWTQFEPRSER